MFKKDGKYVVFTIEVESIHKAGEWNADYGMADNSNGSAYQGAIVVKGLSFSGVHDGKMLGTCVKEYQEFLASGECWQKLGIHGSFNTSSACNLAAALAESNPTRRFRVRRTIIEQNTTYIAHFSMPEVD
jgi:hypothetical protein